MGTTLAGIYDVAIIGGGPAGSAAAISLARVGHRVVVLSGFQLSHIGEPSPPLIRVPLQRLGLWQEFEAQGHLPSPGVRFHWGGSVTEQRHEESWWQIARQPFDAMLLREVRRHGVFTLCHQARLITRERTAAGNGNWIIDHTVRSRLLLIASGRVGARLPIPGVPQKRRLTAQTLSWVRYFSHAGDNVDLWNVSESHRDGWCAASPLPGNRMAYLSCVDTSGKQETVVAPVVANRLRDMQPLGPASPYAASLWVRDQPEGDGWIFSGDATLASDPVSCLGLATALIGGLEAAKAATAQLDGRRNFAYPSWVREQFHVLQRRQNELYQAERRFPDSPFWQRRSFKASRGKRAARSARAGF